MSQFQICPLPEDGSAPDAKGARNDFLSHEESVQDELVSIAKMSSADDRAAAAVSLANRLQEALGDLGGHRKAVDKASEGNAGKAWGAYRKVLGECERGLQTRANVALSLSGSPFDNARALFADAGSWAIHFSNVRMALSTFLLGLAWGVVGVNWSSYDASLKWAAAGVWAIAGFFLVLFTHFTWRASKNQKKSKSLLPTPNYRAGKKDMGFWPTVRIYLPVGVYVIATAGFVVMLCKWTEAGERQENAAISVTVGKQTSRFESVDAVEVTTMRKELDSLKKRLEEAEGRLKKVEAIPATPNAGGGG